MVATFATPRCIFCHTSLQNAPQKKNAFLIVFFGVFSCTIKNKFLPLSCNQKQTTIREGGNL